ncbi:MULTISPECIES: c-type cytochrome [Pseudomonas]|uniref:C-type cytochrome n=3 Tax=Pseudomonas TaxID=286 RepID=A0A0E3ELC2_PSEPU|nr:MULTISPECIES: c-type cytochrome [Pseudomonas]AIW62977.1 NdaB [Pseudomonas putida]MDD2040201.1 c-type cytochrome [Pseudomonas putida]MDD2045640.1 c-type cytochrome [Pseudomonas putida]MDH1928854.1 c-type cytochrome [Pseudomonas sp. GD03696]QBZ91249.1 c-type cytochrome [Pseudomonas viciae]
MKQALQVVTRHFGSLVLLALSGVAVGADNCDPENGKKVYQICSVCHSNDTTGVHGAAAPNLHGLEGRKVGSVPGFKFSSALRDSGDTWTPQHLDKFLENPMAVYPLTRMAFSGLKNEKDRRDVLCFLSKSSN